MEMDYPLEPIKQNDFLQTARKVENPARLFVAGGRYFGHGQSAYRHLSDDKAPAGYPPAG
jgi:hypothetical protein